MIPDSIKNKVFQVLIPHGVSQIRVFGSYASGNQTSTSDLDLIVTFQSRKDLFDLGEMREEHTEVLGIKIDLLTEGAISPYLKDKILQKSVVIYPER